MKNISILFCLVIFSLSSLNMSAQIKTPAASPLAKGEYSAGLTTVNLEYSRPSMNGRKIFGDLVPYNTMWRTGANKNSMITFSDDVKIGDSEVKKGSYAIFAKPGAASWEVYFYSDTENWGTPENWDDAKVAAKVMVTPTKLANSIETFTINVGHLTNDYFHLEMMWENTNVAIKVEVPTDKKVSANIAQVMGGPTSGDYYNAARYYREAKKDLNQSLAWMNKSIEMGNEKFWVLRQKSLIQADLGDFKGAIETANKSLAMSKEAGNADYIKMNEDSIKQWSMKSKK
ncbi:MAG: DUF2911 domain-containing protein [Saprospiraceae bacterium]|nr:DUF2911 domain-containing protein [Saprospiraceae bacterium]